MTLTARWGRPAVACGERVAVGVERLPPPPELLEVIASSNSTRNGHVVERQRGQHFGAVSSAILNAYESSSV